MRRLADMYQDMQAHALEQSSQSDMKAAQKEAQATALLAAARQNTAFWEDEAARRAGDLSLLRVEKDASIASHLKKFSQGIVFAFPFKRTRV
jgi:hypothetical protein